MLVVDDDANTRGSYVIALERGGYRTLEAANGGEGLQTARARRPDAILMDIGMPVMDGFAASETLKSAPETASIPIVMVTGHTLRRERERMEGLCDGYLYKPCAPQEILGAVARVLEPKGES